MPGLSTGYWLSTQSGRRFAFDAGSLCLEFATTGGEGYRKAWETLHQPADLAAWAARSRLGAAARIDPADVRLTPGDLRSEEHTSELQSRRDLVCRLLLEKKKKTPKHTTRQKKKKNYAEVE